MVHVCALAALAVAGLIYWWKLTDNRAIRGFAIGGILTVVALEVYVLITRSYLWGAKLDVIFPASTSSTAVPQASLLIGATLAAWAFAALMGGMGRALK